YAFPVSTTSSPLGSPARSTRQSFEPGAKTVSGVLVSGKTVNSPFRPCGLRSRPTTRRRGPDSVTSDLDAGLLEERRDGLGRGRAVGEPLLRRLDVEHDLLRVVLGPRVVRADGRHRTAVARGLALGDHDAVQRHALATHAGQTDTSCHSLLPWTAPLT